jgi:hypothetical protein
MNEGLRSTVLRIDEDDILGLPPGCIDRQEDDWSFENLGQGVDDSALEKQEVPGGKLACVGGIAHPKCAFARNYI